MTNPGLKAAAEAAERTAAELHTAMTAWAASPERQAAFVNLNRAFGVPEPEPDRRGRERRLWDTIRDRLRR